VRSVTSLDETCTLQQGGQNKVNDRDLGRTGVKDTHKGKNNEEEGVSSDYLLSNSLGSKGEQREGTQKYFNVRGRWGKQGAGVET